MNRNSLYTLLGFLSILFFSCHPSAKKEEKKPTLPEVLQQEYYKRFEDTGSGNAVLHLIKYNSFIHLSMDTNVIQYSGIFIPNKKTAPLVISGYRINDSIIQLVAYGDYEPLDTLTGQFLDSSFSGKITYENGVSHPFHFEEKYPDGSFHWSVSTFNDSLEMAGSDTVKYKATTDLMALWPGNDIDSINKELITDSISQSLFGRNQAFANSDDLLKAVSDSFLSNYKKTAEDVLSQQHELRPVFNWSLLAYMNITYNANHRISLLFNQYQYRGGAHGLQNEFGLNVDLSTGKILGLSDIFIPNYQKKLQEKLEKAFRQHYDIPKGEPLNGENGLLFDKHLKLTSNFYLTPYGIGFIYNPYEVAPYVVGRINLYLPYNELKDLLKK